MVRGTALVSSLRALRSRGLERTYFDECTPNLAPRIRAILPQSWQPIDLVDAHYQLLDRLVRDPEEQRELGRLAGASGHGVVAKVLSRSLVPLGGAVLNAALARLGFFWSRFAKGGGVRAWRTGEHRARIAFMGLSISRLPYVRHAFAAHIAVNLQLFDRNVEVRSLAFTGGNQAEFDVRWT